jgi:serine protease Do
MERFSMRSSFAVCALAIGLLCLARPLPAQFNSPQALNLFADPGVSGSRIGVALLDMDADRASELKLGSVTGVEVMGVENGSPAQQAGIRTGDVLLSYNNESIIGAQQLGRLVGETPIGRKVKIEYLRDGKVCTVHVITAAAPKSILSLNPGQSSFPREFAGASEFLFPGSIPRARFVWTNPWFGIEGEALDSDNSQLADYFGVRHGVLIRAVVKDSPAAKGGMHAGDVVTHIGDHAVADPKDIAAYIRLEQHFSKPIAVEVVREHKTSTLKINLSQDSQE